MNMKIDKKNIKGNLITAVLYVIVLIGVVILGGYNVKDLKEVKKAEKTLIGIEDVWEETD